MYLLKSSTIAILKSMFILTIHGKLHIYIRSKKIILYMSHKTQISFTIMLTLMANYVFQNNVISLNMKIQLFKILSVLKQCKKYFVFISHFTKFPIFPNLYLLIRLRDSIHLAVVKKNVKNFLCFKQPIEKLNFMIIQTQIKYLLIISIYKFLLLCFTFTVFTSKSIWIGHKLKYFLFFL